MSDPTWYPPFIAHRGAGQQVAENTLAAIQVGAGYGFQVFECDVQASLDGRLFLLHDATLERTTNGRGIASEQTWQQLSEYRISDGQGSMQEWGLPLLEDVWLLSQQLRLGINLELKTTDAALERTAYALADWLLHQKPLLGDFPLVLSSFQTDGLRILQQQVPQIARACLFREWQNTHIDTAFALETEAIHFHHTALTAERVRFLKHEGFRVWAYTVNEAEQAIQLLRWGVDSLCTDNMLLPSQVPMSVQMGSCSMQAS